jgi:hypothetical protein
MMQVRALIKGQDWFDLRQYRLNPPFGADIHWSRGSSCCWRPFSAGRPPSWSRWRQRPCCRCSSRSSRWR